MLNTVITGKPHGENFNLKLHFIGRMVIASVISLLADREEIEVRYLASLNPNADPLSVLEEEMLGEEIAQKASKVATNDNLVAIRIFNQLQVAGKATVTGDELWSMVGACNGAYIQFRSQDLDAAGSDYGVGDPGAVDVDSALAGILGSTRNVETTQEPWSSESMLFALLTEQLMDVIT